jgi:plastocyanin
MHVMQWVAIVVALTAASRRPAPPHGDPASGRHVYERYCIQCHGERADGAGEVARWARPKPRDFRQGIFKFRSTPFGSLPTSADLERTIRGGLYGTVMPPFAAVSPRDRADVIAYLQTISPRWRTDGPGTPISVPDEPRPTREDITRGRELFGANCSVCHGDGTGNGPSSVGLLDAWRNPIQPADLTKGRGKATRTASDIYMRIMTGINGTPMPGFAGTLTADAAWQIAHYVQALGGWAGSTAELTELAATLPPPDVLAAPAAPVAAPSAPLVVRMMGDAQGYRFEPASITAHVGDVITFVNVSGGPHNVSFWPDSIPSGTAAQLGRNMGPTANPLSSALLVQPNVEYRVSLADLPPGTYKFYCMPHLALGMKGQIVVQR